MSTAAPVHLPAPQPADAVDARALQRVLVIKLRHEGDVLLASPVLAALRRAAPQAEIDALVYAPTAPMLRGHPALAQLHLVQRRSACRGPWDYLRTELRLLRDLRARRYDLIVHLTDHPRGAWLAGLLHPRWAVAAQRDPPRLWWRLAFTHLAAQPRTPRPVVERNLDLLRRIGIRPAIADLSPTFALDAGLLAAARARLREAGWRGGPYAVVHPGSRWLFKTWTAEGNASVIEHLAGRGFAVVMTAAPGPREAPLCDAVLAACRAPVLDLRGRTTLPELAALLRQADFFFGVDSAPMHLAAAVGTPGVVLFGPSSDAEWGPWSPAIRVVASQCHRCRPCLIDGCGAGKRSDCLDSLPVPQVLSAIDLVLQQQATAAPAQP